jgi:uncharacterized damage-inducible protein DinB
VETGDVFKDAYGRIQGLVHRIAEGLDAESLAYRPDVGANSIGWLLWHLIRVQDNHIAELAAKEEAWVTDGWAERFGMEPDPTNTGYGHTSEEVGAVRPDGPAVLVEYQDAVTANVNAYLDSLDSEELDRLIDFSWDPPVSVGVRLVSVIGDCYQHAGQASYVKGMIERRA